MHRNFSGKLWRVENSDAFALNDNVEGSLEDIDILNQFADLTADPLITNTRASQLYSDLIFRHFSHALPVPAQFVGRFKPEFYTRNAFYGGLKLSTAVYEASYYFMKERMHLPEATSVTASKISFNVDFSDPNALDVQNHPHVLLLTNRRTWADSWVFIKTVTTDSVVYPSARHTEGFCVLCYEIGFLATTTSTPETLNFVYDREKEMCIVFKGRSAIETIHWRTVS